MWVPLGEVTPQFDLWLPFPDGINAGGATAFRARFFSSGNIENIFSYLWFRRVWQFGTFRDKEVERAERLYPQIHSVILYLPIPPAFEYVGAIPAGYEVKLERRFRRGTYAEPNFYISLDAFIADPQNPSGSPQQQIEQINLQLQEMNSIAIETFEDLKIVDEELDKLIENFDNLNSN